MADVLDDSQVMSDEKKRNVPPLLELLEKIDDLSLDGDVQRTHGFITNDQARIDGQRSGDADALALASTKLMGITAGVLRIKAHKTQEIADALNTLVATTAKTVDGQRLTDDGLDGHARIERTGRVLKDHLQLTPVRTQGATG
jgi:hypothetical protein